MIPITKLTNALSAGDVIALSDDNGDGIADAGVIEDAIAASENEVRAALHAADLQSTSALTPVLEDLVVTLAVARLFERRHQLLNEPWRDRLQRAHTILRAIAAGRLPVSGVPPIARVRAAPPDSPLHRRTTLAGY